MFDLFFDDEVFVDTDAMDYVISGPHGTVARAAFRSPQMKHEVRHLLRSLVSRFATPRNEFVVSDGDDVPRFEIVSGLGHGKNIDLTITDSDGQPVGNVTAAAGLLNAFPKIQLTDAAGQQVGHLTTSGAPDAFDAAGRQIAEVTLGSTRPAFGKLRYELRFYDGVSPQARLLVFAGLIGYDLTR